MRETAYPLLGRPISVCPHPPCVCHPFQTTKRAGLGQGHPGAPRIVMRLPAVSCRHTHHAFTEKSKDQWAGIQYPLGHPMKQDGDPRKPVREAKCARERLAGRDMSSPRKPGAAHIFWPFHLPSCVVRGVATLGQCRGPQTVAKHDEQRSRSTVQTGILVVHQVNIYRECVLIGRQPP